MAAAAAVAEARKAWQQQGLPISTETSVPLSDVLHKCVQNAYRRLQDLMEILPNHTIPNISRMRQVLDYVVTQRRYLIRLLILVRWAQKCSEPMQHAMNVHAFLTTKDREYEDAANALVAIHAASRRLPARMFDVVTAIDVLTVRGATRLPMIVRQRATEVQPLLPHERDATLKQLALMMGARCLYSHILPRPMRRAMRFTAGCTVFDLPNEFYLALTTTSHDPAVPWRVVKFRFACIPNLSPAHMARLHQTFERILATGETAAAEKPLATTTATPEGEASAKTPVTETKVTSASTAVMPEEALSVTQKPTENTGAIDAVTDPAAIMAAPQHREEHVLVLMRLYNFIHGFCLRYTLETLAAKVAELSTFRWQGHLQTKYDPQQSLLEVRFWTTSGLIQTTLRESERAIPTTSKGHGSARRTGAAPALREVLGGVFTIKIQPSLHHADHGDLSEFGALETISQNLFGSEKHDDLCVNVYASRLKGMDRAPVDATVAAAAELLVDGVDPTCLKAQQWTVDLAQADMEAVLLQVVALKSMACLRYLEEALVACRTQTPSAATKPSRTAADDHHLAIGKHWMTDNTLCIELLPDRDLLSIMIDAHSGKLQVLERSKQPLYQFFETMLNTTLDLPAALRWLQQGRLVQSWGHFAQVLGSSVTQHLDVAGLDGILDRLHEPAGGAAGDRTGARRAGMDAVAPSPSPWTDADRSMTFQLFIQVEADEWYLHVAAAPTSGTFDVSILRLAPPRDNGEPRRDAADILALDPAIVGLDHWRDTSIAAMQALQTRVLAFTRQTRLLQQLEAKGLQYLLSWRTNGETYGLTCPLHPADPTVAVAAPDAVAERDAAYRAAHQQARLALTLQTGAVVVPAAPFMPFSPLAFFVHGNLALGEMIGSEAQLPLASLPPIDADPRMALSQWLQTQSPLSATKASMDTDAKTEINAKPSEDTGGAASRLEEEDQIYLQGDACLHIACPSLDRLILAWRRVAWVLQLAMDYHAQQPLFDRAGVSLVAFSVSRLQLRLDDGSLLEFNVHSGTPLLTAPPAAAASAAAAAPTSPSAPEPKGALAASLKPMVTTMAHPAFRDALVKALTLPPAQPPASPAAEPPAVAEEATTPLLASLRSVRRLRQLYDWVMTHGPRELVAFPSSPSSDGSPSAGAAAWTVALPALSLLDVQFGPVAHLLIRLLPNGDVLIMDLNNHPLSSLSWNVVSQSTAPASLLHTLCLEPLFAVATNASAGTDDAMPSLVGPRHMMQLPGSLLVTYAVSPAALACLGRLLGYAAVLRLVAADLAADATLVDTTSAFDVAQTVLTVASPFVQFRIGVVDGRLVCRLAPAPGFAASSPTASLTAKKANEADYCAKLAALLTAVIQDRRATMSLRAVLRLVARVVVVSRVLLRDLLEISHFVTSPSAPAQQMDTRLDWVWWPTPSTPDFIAATRPPVAVQLDAARHRLLLLFRIYQTKTAHEVVIPTVFNWSTQVVQPWTASTDGAGSAQPDDVAAAASATDLTLLAADAPDFKRRLEQLGRPAQAPLVEQVMNRASTSASGAENSTGKLALVANFFAHQQLGPTGIVRRSAAAGAAAAAATASPTGSATGTPGGPGGGSAATPAVSGASTSAATPAAATATTAAAASLNGTRALPAASHTAS